MNPLDIVWPAIAMALLMFVIGGVMFASRMKHMKANPPKPEDFADGASALRYFGPVEMPSNNFRNLFEVPVLFFVLVILTIITGFATETQAIIAWVYVGLRIVHSYAHIGKNVKLRFQTFLISTLALFVMWVGFAIDYAMQPHILDAL